MSGFTLIILLIVYSQNNFFIKFRWENAESDCTSGLRLHPDNPKALWRRGIARRELGKLEEAKNGKYIFIILYMILIFND